MKAALKPTSASTTSTAHGDQMIGEDGWPVHLEALVGPGLSSPSGDVEGIRMENFPDEGWTCYIIKKKTRGKDVVKYQHPTCEKALGKAAFKTYSNKGGVMTVDLEDFPFQPELCLTIYKSRLESQPKATPTSDDNTSASTPSPPPVPLPEPDPATPPVPTACPPGIANLGATCYLNSLLQCLFQNVPFRDGLYQYSSEQHPLAADKKLFEILRELQVLFSQLENGVKGCLELKELTDKLGLNTAEQQDPQEFITLFMGKVEESFRSLDGPNSGSSSSGPNLQDLISNIFRGKIKQVIKCKNCGIRSKKTYEDEIRLPLNYDTEVQTCVDNFFEAEVRKWRRDETLHDSLLTPIVPPRGRSLVVADPGWR